MSKNDRKDQSFQESEVVRKGYYHKWNFTSITTSLSLISHRWEIASARMDNLDKSVTLRLSVMRRTVDRN